MCYSRYRRLSQECKGNLWTKEEEAQIFSLVEKNGEKWKRISQ